MPEVPSPLLAFLALWETQGGTRSGSLAGLSYAALSGLMKAENEDRKGTKLRLN